MNFVRYCLPLALCAVAVELHGGKMLKGDETRLKPLVMAPGETRPFGGQHKITLRPVAVRDAKGRDLYGKGTLFGVARELLYPFLGMEGDVPVYGLGEPLADVPDGKTDGTFVFDLDGDGVEDAIVARALQDGQAKYPDSAPYPFNGKAWDGIESPYAGAGRGYDIRGNWLADQTRLSTVCWMKGRRDKNGMVTFGKRQSVWSEMRGYPVMWKCLYGIQSVGVIKSRSGLWLVLHGNVDELAALPISVVNGEVQCGKARPFLSCGWTLPDIYKVNRLIFVDLDGDGVSELLADGNPGTVAVYKGDDVGRYRPVGYALQRGGALAAQTLTAPCRFDWDGDGKDDLITGDASGYLMLWRGTVDPTAYRTPVLFTVDGEAVHHVAGPSGSVQGPRERRWGYLKPVAGTWGGSKALITCDIKGELLLYRPDGKGGGASALASSVPFSREGTPFTCAWRSRPAIAPRGFCGATRDALVLMDFDGDLAFAEVGEIGGTDFVRVEKLKGANGGVMHFCGTCGAWGRGHISLVDWDGDGKTDILFGTSGKGFTYFEPKDSPKHQATVRLYRNLGTEAEPRFDDGELMTLKDGTPFFFGGHNATPWVTDLDGDGGNDLIVGAENGRVYWFRREEFSK